MRVLGGRPTLCVVSGGAGGWGWGGAETGGGVPPSRPSVCLAPLSRARYWDTLPRCGRGCDHLIETFSHPLTVGWWCWCLWCALKVHASDLSSAGLREPYHHLEKRGDNQEGSARAVLAASGLPVGKENSGGNGASGGSGGGGGWDSFSRAGGDDGSADDWDDASSTAGSVGGSVGGSVRSVRSGTGSVTGSAAGSVAGSWWSGRSGASAGGHSVRPNDAPSAF